MTNENPNILFGEKLDNDEVPGWKHLDEAVRKWAAMTGMENDLSYYQRLKENCQ
jgi:hypothetical protein